MGFKLSPGVYTSEVDMSTIIPAVGTTEGATVGFFTWGPGNQATLVDSQETLKTTFGAPNSQPSGENWWAAANFLSYSTRLHVVRAIGAGSNNSIWGGSGATTYAKINNDTDYTAGYNSTTHKLDGVYGVGDTFIAGRYPGDYGNNIRVSICDSTTQYQNNATNLTINDSAAGNLSPNITHTAGELGVGDILSFVTSGGDAADATGTYQITSINGKVVTLNRPLSGEVTAAKGNVVRRNWEGFSIADSAPGTSEFARDRNITNDEFHIAVIDDSGLITGFKGTVIESFPYVSKLSDATTIDGAPNYWKTVLQNQSDWILASSNPASADVGTGTTAWGATGAAASGTAMKQFDDLSTVGNTLFQGATAGENDAALQNGWDTLTSDDIEAGVDFSLAFTGSAGGSLSRYVVDNVAEERKDCVVFISPEKTDVVNQTSASKITDNIIAFRNTDAGGLLAINSTYGVLDSGWKYQYDKYNQVNRWVPLNGDIAGLCAQTDGVRDPWFSPAGFQRGNIKNVIKLAWNPSQTYRDRLYQNQINPVVTFPGQGTVLYGDKTLSTRPSAFDRINVRRLFIALEKAIAIAARYSLFEFNDSFTRAQFRNMVDPFLREIEGRRGITAFRVVCDESNNTSEIIDRNEFVGDIYVQPARSINFIQLNFVATRTGVNFDEIVRR